MAKVTQGFLPLNWEVIEQSSDLDRLRMVLRGLDDEDLTQLPQGSAYKGRRMRPLAKKG